MNVNNLPFDEVDRESGSNMAVLTVPGLSFSRLRINRVAMDDGSPISSHRPLLSRAEPERVLVVVRLRVNLMEGADGLSSWLDMADTEAACRFMNKIK